MSAESRSDTATLPRSIDASKPAWAEGLMWLAALAIVRVGALGVFYLISGGRHFTDDWGFMSGYLDDPLSIIMLRAEKVAQPYPPLYPIVYWAIGRPISLYFSSFVSVRLTSVVLELCAWPLVWALLGAASPAARDRRVLALLYVLAPACIMATSGFAQEEPISLFFFCAVALTAASGRLRTACVLAATGVVIAKVYFLVPLLAVLVATLRHDRPTLPRGLGCVLALTAPIWVVYGAQVVIAVANHMPLPLSEFTSHGDQSTSPWALVIRWFGMTGKQAKYASMLTGLVAGLTPLVLAVARGIPLTGWPLVRVCAAMYLAVYVFFYHCDPEYFIVLVPAALVLLPRLWGAMVVMGAWSLPWAINVFYGIANAKESAGPVAGGKAVFVSMYDRLTSVDPRPLHAACVLLLAACNVAILAYWLRTLAERRPHPAVVDADDIDGPRGV